MSTVLLSTKSLILCHAGAVKYRNGVGNTFDTSKSSDPEDPRNWQEKFHEMPYLDDRAGLHYTSTGVTWGEDVDRRGGAWPGASWFVVPNSGLLYPEVLLIVEKVKKKENDA